MCIFNSNFQDHLLPNHLSEVFSSSINLQSFVSLQPFDLFDSVAAKQLVSLSLNLLAHLRAERGQLGGRGTWLCVVGGGGGGTKLGIIIVIVETERVNRMETITQRTIV